VAQRAKAFGLHVVGHDPFLSPGQITARGLEPVSFDDLLAQAEIISLHLPSQVNKRPLLDQAALAQIRSGALLINVSRGDLVDIPAARAALEAGRLSGLALDVWETEPPREIDPLFDHPQVIVTPHAAFYSTASVRALHERTAEEVVRVLSAQPPKFAVNQPHNPRQKSGDSK
jgi:D-3-phosphoglycerate dehydrogenase